MRTPTGIECRFFYGDYHRGRNQEECRLLNGAGLAWQAGLCATCPAPSILIANACEHMEFKPKVNKPMFFKKPQVHIDVYCSKCECNVDHPSVGCGQCHPLPDIFIADPHDPNPAT